MNSESKKIMDSIERFQAQTGINPMVVCDGAAIKVVWHVDQSAQIDEVGMAQLRALIEKNRATQNAEDNVSSEGGEI